MSVTTPLATSTDGADRSAVRPTSLRRTTAVAGIASAAIVTAFAAVADAAGVSFEIEGEAIPLLGFAQMTFVGALIGGVILAVLNRRGRSAGRRFVQTSVALTVLSCVPSVAWPDDAATIVVLVAFHLLAAVIVVPALLRHARS